MMRATEEQGFTLVELLIGMVMTSVLMGAVVFLLTAFLNDNRFDQIRVNAQSDGQTIVERLSRELRSAAAPTVGSPVHPGLLEAAGSYDLVFQTVSAGTQYNLPLNHYRVRYCLGANNTLWRQTETWSTATSPAVPDTSACPSTATAWVTASGGAPCCTELNDVTNEIGGDTTRPLFVYGPSGASLAQIKLVSVNLYIDQNPGQQPGPTEVSSGIDLRNELSQPTAIYTPVTTVLSSSSTDLQLDGSASSDPNGQALTYQWYEGGSCSSDNSTLSGGTAMSGGTTQKFDAGDFSPGSQTFSLVVTDTGGLTGCYSTQVTIP